MKQTKQQRIEELEHLLELERESGNRILASRDAYIERYNRELTFRNTRINKLQEELDIRTFDFDSMRTAYNNNRKEIIYLRQKVEMLTGANYEPTKGE